MEIQDFFEEFMKQEYPRAGALRRWWELKKYYLWLSLPFPGNITKKNRDFIKSIPD